MVEPTEPSRMMRIPPPNMLPKASSGGFDEVEIVVASMAGPDYNAHVRNFERFTEYTGGKVTIRGEDVGRDAWHQKRVANMQAGSDVWDVVVIFASNVAEHASNGWAVDMRESLWDNSELINQDVYDIDDFAGPGIGACSWFDGLYALPQHLSSRVTFYRADWFDKWGIERPHPTEGWSFDAMIDAARKAKAGIEADGMDDVWPLVMLMKDNGNNVISWENVGRSLGAYGKLYDERGIPNFTLPEMTEALDLIKGWMDEGLVSPGSVGYEYTDALELIRNSKCAICFQWDTAAVELTDPGASPECAEGLEFTMYPYDSNIGHNVPRLYTSCWAPSVSAYSKYPEIAFSYCAWYTSKEIAFDYLMYGGGHSGRASVLSDPEILAAHRQYASMNVNFEALVPVPTLPEWSYIRSEIANPNMAAFLAGDKTAEEAAQDAQDEAMEYLDEQGVEV